MGFQLTAPDPPRRRKHICGRDPAAGPGTCRFWWETCLHPKTPTGCFHAWANQHGGDVYAWRDRWVSPITGEAWPPVPAEVAS